MKYMEDDSVKEIVKKIDLFINDLKESINENTMCNTLEFTHETISETIEYFNDSLMTLKNRIKDDKAFIYCSSYKELIKTYFKDKYKIDIIGNIGFSHSYHQHYTISYGDKFYQEIRMSHEDVVDMYNYIDKMNSIK